MNKIKLKHYKFDSYELILGSYKEQLCLCDWKERIRRASIDSRLNRGLHADFTVEDSPATILASIQLDEFFRGERKDFTLPLIPVGTEFQKSVWKTLLEIPYGKTLTYKELALKVGRPEAIRAAANANGANPLSIFIPCHRVVGSNGETGGYAGGIGTKLKLLALEELN